MNWLNLSDNVNLLSLIGAAAILIMTIGVAGKYINQMKNDKSEGVLDEHNWDGIQEYRNPLPIGWAVIFLLTIIWAGWYFLIGYPLNSYSQIGEYNEEVQSYNVAFEQQWKNANHETLKEMGKGVFLVQCSPCHGVLGDGIDGKAADFSKWGNEEGIYDAIMKGSKGLGYDLGDMPADLLDKESAKAVAAYVAKNISSVKSTKHPELVQTGEALFATCSACHGEDGAGMGGVAPSLVAYGSEDFVIDVLNRGKQGDIGIMPHFNDGRLSEIQKKAVGTYVLSLSK